MENKFSTDKSLPFIEKYKWLILIIFLFFILITPVIIFLLYYLIILGFENPISADGLLGYIGAVIGSFATLIASIIAIYESKKRYEAENEDAQYKRRLQIRPDIEISFDKLEDNKTYKLIIKNISNKLARRVYLFDTLLCSVLYANEERDFTVTFRDDIKPSSKVKIITQDYFEEADIYGLPKYLLISLYDIDANCVYYDFVIDENGDYELEYKPYCS